MVYVRRGVPPVLPAQPPGHTLGEHELGARDLDRSRALAGAASRHPPKTLDEQGRPIESIFSGSVVVDEDNSSGFGAAGQKPLVAIYTSAYEAAHPTLAGVQAQSLAYSLDNGYTWTKYEGNPVLDRNSSNFRDPKVFRYESDAGTYWVMVAVEAVDHKVVLYRSDDLKAWTYLSDFGPAQLRRRHLGMPRPVRTPGRRRRFAVEVGPGREPDPGAVAGGSGGQYFVGDFDGTTFTSESTQTSDSVPAWRLFAGFDSGGYEGWTVVERARELEGRPLGGAPANGSLPGQNPVTGFVALVWSTASTTATGRSDDGVARLHDHRRLHQPARRRRAASPHRRVAAEQRPADRHDRLRLRAPRGQTLVDAGGR